MIVQSSQFCWAVACIALLSAQAKVSSAASADAVMSEPPALNVADFKNQLRGHLSKNASRTPLDQARDPSAIAELGDLQWQLQELINKKQSLQGVVDLGLTQRSDGSVQLDIKQHPQWMPLYERLLPLDNPQAFEAYVPMLRERGFRDEDLVKIREYAQANRVERLTFEATKPQIDSFSTLVRSRRAQQVGVAQAKSFHYRLKRLSNEAQRGWAEDLLRILDPQRQRILISLFDELVVTKIIAPDANVDAFLNEEMTTMRTAAFDETMKTKEQEFKQ